MPRRFIRPLVAGFIAVAVTAAGCSPDTEPRAERAFDPARCTADATWPEARADWAQEVVTLVNEHRSGLSLPPVAVDPALERGAQWKARHMAHYDYMSHDDPAPPFERDTWERFSDCGFDNAKVAENLADGQSSPSHAMTSWLNSPGHRGNIEDPELTLIGVGVAVGTDGEPVWVQMFGGGASGPDDAVEEEPTAGGAAAPVATDDSLTVEEDGSVLLDVLANDTDPDGGSLTIDSFGTPQAGRIDGDHYVPDANFEGVDTFTYSVMDDEGASSEATVTVTVTAVNDDPTVSALRVRTRPRRTIKVNLLAAARDADGDRVSLGEVGTARFGRLTIDMSAGTATYRARRRTAGRKESIRFEVVDGNGGTAAATLTIVIR